MQNYFPPATTMGASAPLRPAPVSSLAAAMMHPSNFSLPAIGGGMQVPMMNMLMQQAQQARQNGDPSLLQQGINGVGNLLNGYQWNGMAGGQGLDALSQQAGMNAAGMPSMPPTDAYGSMGGFGGMGAGGVY